MLIYLVFIIQGESLYFQDQSFIPIHNIHSFKFHNYPTLGLMVDNSYSIYQYTYSPIRYLNTYFARYPILKFSKSGNKAIVQTDSKQITVHRIQSGVLFSDSTIPQTNAIKEAFINSDSSIILLVDQLSDFMVFYYDGTSYYKAISFNACGGFIVQLLSASESANVVAFKCSDGPKLYIYVYTNPSYSYFDQVIGDFKNIRVSQDGQKIFALLPYAIKTFRINVVMSSMAEQRSIPTTGAMYLDQDSSKIVVSNSSEVLILDLTGATQQIFLIPVKQFQLIDNFLIMLCTNYTILLFKYCPVGTLKYKEDCVINCPDAFSPQLGQCRPCIWNYQIAACVSECQFGYYLSNMVCYKCNSMCATCSSQNLCLSCQDSFLQLSTCVKQCTISNYYKNQITKTCTLCQYLIYRVNNQCIQVCPLTSYQENGFCETCLFDCLVCPTKLMCFKCNSGFLLVQDKCYRECPQRTYYDNQVCALCQSRCLQCDRFNCFKCQYGFSYNKYCLDQCPQDCFETRDKHCLDRQSNSIRLQFKIVQFQNPNMDKTLQLKSSRLLTLLDTQNLLFINSSIPYKFYQQTSSNSTLIVFLCNKFENNGSVQIRLNKAYRSEQGYPIERNARQSVIDRKVICLQSSLFNYLTSSIQQINSKIYTIPFQVRSLFRILNPISLSFKFIQKASLPTSYQLNMAINFISFSAYQTETCWSGPCQTPIQRNLVEIAYQPKSLSNFSIFLLMILGVVLTNKFGNMLMKTVIFFVSDRVFQILFLNSISQFIMSAKEQRFQSFQIVTCLCILVYFCYRIYKKEQLFNSPVQSHIFQQIFPFFNVIFLKYKFHYFSTYSLWNLVLAPYHFDQVMFTIRSLTIIGLSLIDIQPYVLIGLCIFKLVLAIFTEIKIRPYKRTFFRICYYSSQISGALTYSILSINALSFRSLSSQQESQVNHSIIGWFGVISILFQTIAQLISSIASILILFSLDHKQKIVQQIKQWFIDNISMDTKLSSVFINSLIVQGNLNNADITKLQTVRFKSGHIIFNDRRISFVKSIKFNGKADFRKVMFKIFQEKVVQIQQQNIAKLKKQLQKLLTNCRQISFYTNISQSQRAFEQIVQLPLPHESVLANQNGTKLIKYIPALVQDIIKQFN